MNFSVLPPEVNSLRMFTGAGSAPMLQAALGWDGLAAELGSAADSFASMTSALANQAWQGPASQAMITAAAPYAGWLSAAAARAAGAATQAKTIANAFEAARAATIHPLAVAANRTAFVQLVVSNVFGQNAAAIAAAEGVYEQMWAQDVAAMVGYHGGASAAAAALQSWQQVLQTVPGLSDLNLGIGNIGNNNVGSGNTCDDNLGMGNRGNANSGSGNSGDANTGSGNLGTTNLGSGNTGNYNLCRPGRR